MRTIDVAPLHLADLASHLDEVATRRLRDGVEAAHGLLDGRTVWTVTPNASAGSGPAEIVAPIVGYAIEQGIDARWLILDAPAEFLTISARLHAGIHGDRGDGGRLGEKQRDIYEHVLSSNAENVEGVRDGDVVILHDPPTAGLARFFKAAGATVMWRCHLGTQDAGEAGQHAWAFLDRYLEDTDLTVVSCEEYRPPFTEVERCAVIPPSINPDSPKNQVLGLDEAWSVARLSGVFAGEPPFEAVPFVREDGRPDAIRATADAAGQVTGVNLPVPLGSRVVTQVSRWDPLKGMEELVEVFAAHLADLPEDTHLLLVGPQPDPDREAQAQRVLEEVLEAVDLLPRSAARRVHVAAIPARDREVNAVTVNALQRVSTVVTQRSLVEAFGLTVAEAMWKKAPVVASAVGGIRDQVEDGLTGCLVDPGDGAAWASAVSSLLLFPERAGEMGQAAHESVRRSFLPDRHMLQLIDVLAQAIDIT